MIRFPVAALALALAGALSPTASAQANLSGWHVDGQTWLVWDDNLTFTGVESVSIYRSPTPIVSLSDLAASERIGRLYPQDWRAARLQNSLPGGTWTIPDANSGPYTLGANQGLFVHTPRAAGTWHFAVVKTEQLASGPFTTFGPITVAPGPVAAHPQHSGVNAGHPYTVYALWIDGDDDPASGTAAFPVMGPGSCNGTASLFAVFDPTAPPAGAPPAVCFLHGGGGSYWTYRPQQSVSKRIDLHVPAGVYVTPDEHLLVNANGAVMPASSRWLGMCADFDRFADISLPPGPAAVVVDHQHRRLRWLLQWLQTERGVDADRISIAGLSMGGRGTEMFTRANPELIASALTFVMPVGWPSLASQAGTQALMGTELDDLPTTLPGGYSVNDVLEPYTLLAAADAPFGRHIGGTTDHLAPWPPRPTLYRAWNDRRAGAACYWDGRGHTASSPTGWAGQHFDLSPKLTPQHLTSYRRNQSFPAFHDVDHGTAAGQQPDPGAAVTPANGDPWGTWGGWFEWDPTTIVDTPDRWECDVWLELTAPFAADNAPTSSAQASVTLRRLQQFQATPHEVLWVELRDATTGAVTWSGAVQADAAGVVTVPELSFGTQRLRLVVQRGYVGGPLVSYGAPTPGCGAAPTVFGLGLPQIGNLGFALLYTNGVAPTAGVAVISLAPGDLEVLGVRLHVDVLTSAPITAVITPAVAATPVPIPNVPALVQARLYAQALILDACGAQGLSSSAALQVTIQP